MMFILRWPVVLVLLALTLASLLPAVLGTIEANNIQIDVSAIGQLSDNLKNWAASTTIYERVLWYAAALFFFIAAIRLIRRTQGFWMWLLGFACYGGRWALTQQREEGGLQGTIESVASLQAFQPDQLAAGSSSAQVSFLVFLLVLGLIIFIIDAADRSYWDRRAGA